MSDTVPNPEKAAMEDQIKTAIATFIETVQKIAMAHAAAALGDLTVALHEVSSGDRDTLPSDAKPVTPVAAPRAARVVHNNTPRRRSAAPSGVAQATADRIVSYIEQHAGRRSGTIRQDLGLTDWATRVTLRQLVKKRVITTSGSHAATRYFVTRR